MGLFFTGNDNLLPCIQLVAMDHGIIDGLRQADENIGIEVLVNIHLLHQVLDKFLDLANAAGI